MLNNITNSVIYIGADDRELDLFEGQYQVPEGMAYNSYVILDEKIAVMDTIDRKKTDQWLGNIEEAVDGRTPDYLIIQHMEPDHSASIKAFVEKYPDTVVVGNKKTFAMIGQFFPKLSLEKKQEVANGETLELGEHKLSFFFAPMVHWPEVMMTYDAKDQILFSADAFGKFGALEGSIIRGANASDDWACEARRYYTGIVGKYGAQVQPVLKKASGLDFTTICPLHGPILTEDLTEYLDLYQTWSSYEPETKGVCICYTSVYGNTQKAVQLLEEELKKQGEETIAVSDLARCDMAEAVEDAFRYDRLVLATTTYNSDIFPFMNQFIDHLTERNYQKRFVALMENGSWGPMALRIMKGKLEKSKNLIFAENNVTIKSALNEASEAQVKALAKELVDAAGASDHSADSGASADSDKSAEDSKKGFVCKICGYVYEGDTLPEGFTCPLCKQGADQFEPL